jgi:xylulokinase
VGGLAGRPVSALGITWQRESFVLLDGQDRPLRPAVLWYDSRAAAEVAELQTAIGAESYHRRTGKQLDITSAAAKLLWLKRHESDSIARACRFADVGAYLAHRFTGRWATAAAGADTTGLIALHDHQWLPEYLGYADASHLLFPDLLASTTVCGESRASGLPAGLPVVLAGGDGHCVAAGAAAATGAGSTAATISLGTSAVLGVSADTPVLGSGFRTLIGCVPGTYVLESVVQCGSATLNWFDTTFAGLLCDRSPADWDATCAEVPPGSHGLLVLPHWRGARVPHNDPRATGLVLGWNDRVTPATFRRAIMEGIALEFAELLDSVAGAAGVSCDTVAVGGGGSRADVWCGILADAFGVPVRRPRSVELSSLGASWCARRAVAIEDEPPLSSCWNSSSGDEFTPDRDRVALYAGLREIHRTLYAATARASHALAEAGV